MTIRRRKRATLMSLLHKTDTGHILYVVVPAAGRRKTAVESWS